MGSRTKRTVSLRWPGVGVIGRARDAVRAGKPVEIELPLEMHHALCSHLASRKPEPASIDAAGGAELLAPLAAVAGLEDLARLASAVRRARYRVLVSSPEPVLALLPPP